MTQVEELSGLTSATITGDAWLERYGHALMNTFGRPQRVLVRGEGCFVWDADGRRYLDLLGGLAVNSLGHAHPLLNAAITAQLATLGHVSNFFATGPQIALAERLLAMIMGTYRANSTENARDHGKEWERLDGRVFFTNSGAEANEAAFKIARRTGRTKIVAAEGGFHGRTIGALSMTGKPSIREPFEPLAPGVTHVPFGDADAFGHRHKADIGYALAVRAKALGMTVVGSRRRSTEPMDGVDRIYTPEQLQEMIAEADHVAITLPSTPRTAGLFGSEEFKAMKDSAIIYNIGRGDIIKQDELIEALNSGVIAGAGLDVTTPEPLNGDSQLWDTPGVFITCHYSGSTPYYWDRGIEIIAENIRRIRNDEPLFNLVDKVEGY
jgi:phosphoglycerate dehydrogenase-like enzyme